MAPAQIVHALEDSVALGKAADRAGVSEDVARKLVAELAHLPANQVLRIIATAHAQRVVRSNRNVRRGR